MISLLFFTFFFFLLRQFFSPPHFAGVCGSVPLLSGPPDSALTVRQRSRKMAVIHFVPCHRRGSFFPSAHYLQTRLDISAGHTASFLSGPGPPYSGGLGLVDDPLWILSAGPACNHPAHSRPPPGKKNKKKMHKIWQPHGRSCWGGSCVSFPTSQKNSHHPKKLRIVPCSNLCIWKYC